MRAITIAAVLLGGLLLHPAIGLARAEARSALETFTATHARITARVDAGAEAKELQGLADELLDYRWITEAALGGPSHYEARCAPRCDELRALLTQLVRKSYLDRLSAAERGQVEVLTAHVRDKATKVDTRVTYVDADGETKVISVDYVMHHVAGRWLVRDVITDGVSLAKNYRYELLRLHEEGGVDHIIARLKRTLEAKR